MECMPLFMFTDIQIIHTSTHKGTEYTALTINRKKKKKRQQQRIRPLDKHTHAEFERVRTENRANEPTANRTSTIQNPFSRAVLNIVDTVHFSSFLFAACSLTRLLARSLAPSFPFIRSNCLIIIIVLAYVGIGQRYVLRLLGSCALSYGIEWIFFSFCFCFVSCLYIRRLDPNSLIHCTYTPVDGCVCVCFSIGKKESMRACKRSQSAHSTAAAAAVRSISIRRFGCVCVNIELDSVAVLYLSFCCRLCRYFFFLSLSFYVSMYTVKTVAN